MKKILSIVWAVILCSCSKSASSVVSSGASSDAPEAYVKVSFTADVEEVRTVLDGTAVHWTGDESVYVWYKDAEGAVHKALAQFDAISGSSASLSALLPQDANQNEFYAEVNGVNDESAQMNPWGERGPRVITKVEQTAVPGSYDPAAMGLGARWTAGDSEKPFFRFHNLHNLLQITIDNQTGKILDTLSLSSSSPMVCKNYWKYDDAGALKISYSGGSGTQIKLVGEIGAGKADYYMVVPVKNNNGSKFQLDDMLFRAYCTTDAYYEACNTAPLLIDKNSLSHIGTFTITKADLHYPDGAPFGTYWGTAFMKAWNTAGFSANTPFAGLATYDTRDVVTAKATAKTAASINSSASGNERMVGQFSFEFVAAQIGTGVLSFWSKPGIVSHTSSVLKNGTPVHTVSYASTDFILTSVSIDVEAGDIIKIQYNNGSSYAALSCGGDYLTSSGDWVDRRIRWDSSNGSSGSISSPEDLGSDSQPFFNEI